VVLQRVRQTFRGKSCDRCGVTETQTGAKTVPKWSYRGSGRQTDPQTDAKRHVGADSERVSPHMCRAFLHTCGHGHIDGHKRHAIMDLQKGRHTDEVKKHSIVGLQRPRQADTHLVKGTTHAADIQTDT